MKKTVKFKLSRFSDKVLEGVIASSPRMSIQTIVSGKEKKYYTATTISIIYNGISMEVDTKNVLVDVPGISNVKRKSNGMNYIGSKKSDIVYHIGHNRSLRISSKNAVFFATLKDVIKNGKRVGK